MSFGWVHKTAAAALVIASWSGLLARAQFVPGRIFAVDFESYHCKANLDNEYVLELDPDRGTTRVFAEFNNCPGLRSMAMSPDGKHLRVAAEHWGAILEFSAQGDWQIVIDGSDGVFPTAIANSIAYDREGNFYLSNYYTLNAKVVMFPADGGPKQVLAYRDNNGVILNSPFGLSIGPGGEVYVAEENRLFRIDKNGEVTLFDSNPTGAFFYSVLVDDSGFLHAKTGAYWYRYILGISTSREVFADCDGFGEDICYSYILVMSPDRSSIYAQSGDPVMVIGLVLDVSTCVRSHCFILDSDDEA